MIIIECENLQLQLISKSDLEMVRGWRNEQYVAEFMEFRKIISEEDQQYWFNNLNKECNLYFKILVDKEPIGLINLKEINWEKGTAEAGIFVGNKNFIGGISPMFSILILMKTAFKCFILNELFAKISKKNINAINFNRQLGYQYYSTVNDEFDLYNCKKSSFFSPQSSISRINQLFAKNASVNVYVDSHDKWILKYLHFDDIKFQLIEVPGSLV
jgi:RimJ/RimL family protein N-acetyltransferase